MPNRRLLISGFAVAAVSLGCAACRPFTTSTSGHAMTARGNAAAGVADHRSAGNSAASSSGRSTPSAGNGTEPGVGHDRYLLRPMPTGTVVISRTARQRLRAQITMYGLTPGSAHGVYIDEPDRHRVAFPVLMANSTGQVAATLTSLRSVEWHAQPGRFVVQLGPATDPVAAEPIATTTVLPPRPGVEQAGTLHAVAVSTGGLDDGYPRGYATISYEPNAQILVVTVTAHGLNPGPHAAHIHIGSCKSQGPVKYMLADFIADAHGDITNQTRTIRNVPTVSAHGAWYLNVHQGGMNQILANGAPTLNFRPLLCTNISNSFSTGSHG